MLLKKYNIKNSQLFWNSIPIIAQIALGIYNIEFLFFAQIFLSAISLFGFLLSDGKIPYFMYFTISVSLLGIIFGIIIGSEKFLTWLCNNPVKKFNTWLDTERVKKEEEKLNFDKFKEKITN